MSEASFKSKGQKVGQWALHAQVCPDLPEPPVRSYVTASARKTVVQSSYTEEFYPLQYATGDSLLEDLVFAFKYEPLDLGILVQALQSIGSATLQEWISNQPTGTYTRRAWFFYEKFVGPLDLADAASGNYVDALDPEKHYVAAPINSKRHRVRDNLLGNPRLCPILRRTDKLRKMEGWDLAEQTARITHRYNNETLARAITYLYTKETRSSYAIEGENPSPERESRFLAALRKAGEFFPADKCKLLKLQADILDPRYAATDWRDIQNFVGQTTRGFGELIHFICPRPQDVPSLMQGWFDLSSRLLDSPLDPILSAAVLAFSFVFIHPFEDGNGRTHRFVIHAFLATKNFGPPGILLPVSAAILRQKAEYERVLESFSRPQMNAIQWSYLPDQSIQVHNETAHLYRFFDATPQVEFLFARAAEAIQMDLVEEAEFLQNFDQAMAAVRAVVDMPDKRAALLVKLCLENHGRLSKRKRGHFDELTETELERIQIALIAIVQRTHRLSVVGWSESQLRQRLMQPDVLFRDLERALEQREVEWSYWEKGDRRDEFGEPNLLDYQVEDMELEEIESEPGQAYVVVNCEILCEIEVPLVVADNGRRRIYYYDHDSESRPRRYRTTSCQELQLPVRLELMLAADDLLEVTGCSIEESSLRVSRPDPDSLRDRADPLEDD